MIEKISTENLKFLCNYLLYSYIIFFFFCSNVDNNPEYDNLHIKGMDEEDKYFDSESPVEEILPVEIDTEEIILTENDTKEDDTEEDELETYMSMLKKNEITDSVTDEFKRL